MYKVKIILVKVPSILEISLWKMSYYHHFLPLYVALLVLKIDEPKSDQI